MNGIFCLSVCLSVCPSVCPSHLFDYVPIVVSSWNFQELSPRTRVTSMQKVKVRGQRSRSQRSTANLAVSGLQLQFEFTYGDEMMHIAWFCLEEVPYCFSRSSVKFQGHTALKIVGFDPDLAFPDCNSSLNSPMAKKWCTKLEVALKRCPIVFSCDQAAIWLVLSVCLSVGPSVCLSHLFHHVPIIVSSWNFQELLPWSKVMSMQKVKVKGQGHRGQHPT